MGLSFLAWGASGRNGVGGAAVNTPSVGSLGLGVPFVQPGKELLASRIKFDYSGLAALSPFGRRVVQS